MTTRTISWSGSMMALVASLLVGGPAARADVAPGDRITASNIAKVKDLISPGLEWCIRKGFPITIGETKRIEHPKAYKEATERYSGQVRLSADGLRLENYVAGQPFPVLDPKDPQIAVKIMWNYDYRSFYTDDSDVRNFDADTGTITSDGGFSVERHFLLDHLRRLNWNGRLYVDPKPEKTPNPTGLRNQQGLYPVLEPYDMKGVGALTYRYLDPSKQDDSWLYLPALRRVRRLSTSQRSDALFGQDTDIDSFDGYAGQNSWMDWKFLGERDVIGVMHAKNYPVKWASKVDWAFDEVWEKRHVYVVEGTSKLPQYAYSKRVLFIDKESGGITFSDIYDRGGELWKIWINDVSFRRQAIPGGISYPDEQNFVVAIVMVDLQLEHATRSALPSPRFPGEQGWYFNQGELAGNSDKWFTVSALVSGGR